MKGVVFNLLEEIVVREHGEETWDLLLERAGLGGVYTSLGNYPDGTSRRSLPWLARCSRCQPTRSFAGTGVSAAAARRALSGALRAARRRACVRAHAQRDDPPRSR